ncbi:MAG TPA: type II secretion system protein GspC [Anaeromyxobacteraceae bacterium]|jgi:general secretion pathway protein C|nr:type II secretion system protein GspC [Anaeromyxobacteraceae bacterium]
MLDLFFRKYVWAANALLLFAAAWLCAKTVNTVVGAAIRPTPQIDLRAAPPPPPRPPPAQVEPEKIYTLIGQKPPAPAPEGSAEAAPPPPRTCEDAKAAPVKTTLRGQLVAGVIADKPQWSIASITDLASRETRIYGVGDQFQGAKVLAIGRMKEPRDITGQGYRMVAVVCHDGRKEYLDFEPGEAAAAQVAAPFGAPPAAAGPGAPPAEGVKQLADNRYDVKRTVIDQNLSNMSSLATQARMVPNFKNGVANGFKLFSIQPGSLYTSIGIENGDVVTKINGYEINSPDKALEVYQKLKEANHISLELERNGQPIRKEYNVTGP